MEEPLSGLILPRRKSATQATRAFAAQLDSTDDDDSDSRGSESNGEPKRKVSKKKGSSKGEQVEKSYRKRVVKVKPAIAAAAATTHLMSSHGASRVVSTEQESSTRPRPRPIVNKKKASSPLLISSPPSKMVCKSAPFGAEEPNTCLAKPKSRNGGVVVASRNPQSTLELGDKDSDLTSLSGGSRHASPDSEVEIVEFVPAPVSKPSHGASNSSTRSPCEGRQHKQVKWTTHGLGSYVWVLVEPKNVRVFDPESDKDDPQDWLWWPGKIISARSTDIPLQVKLFKLKNVAIPAPCEGNVVSKLDSLGRWRFINPTFLQSSLLKPQQPQQHQHQQHSSILASPRKKSKHEREDIESKRREANERRWKDAVDEMRQEEEEEEGSDYLPEIGEMFTRPLPFMSAAFVSGAGRGKRKRGDLSDECSDHAWEPPGPDETLQIPGELVLSRETGSGPSAIHQLDHWPAKILAYMPPSNPKQQPKYRVTWLDGSEGLVARSWFYTLAEEGFASCKLGIFESSVADVANDDEDEDIEVVKARWDFSRRSLSPEVTEPPQSVDAFKEFSIRLQFAYTKPVLSAILNQEYGPVMELHQLFMAGGLKRTRLNQHSSRRGNMDVNEVEELTHYLKEWCLRSMLPMKNILDMGTDENEEVEVLNGREGALEMDLMEETGVEQNPLAGHDFGVDVVIAVEVDRQDSCPPSSQPTEVMPSSPPDLPPSSLPTDREHSLVLENSFTEPPTLVNDTVDQMAIDDNQAVHQQQRPPRQKGSDEYESLSDLEKLHYCTAILLPECVRQILLWKIGARTSLQLLSGDEEQELFDKGDELLNEKDWVFDIKRARQRAETLLQPNPSGTGRRRTQPVNYCE